MDNLSELLLSFGKLLTSKWKFVVIFIIFYHVEMWKHKENKLVDGETLSTYFRIVFMRYLGLWRRLHTTDPK